ncbi:unnamed protein product, partial [Porites evermanni]
NKNKRAKPLRESTSISQSDKDKYLACMSIPYMSSEESLSEPESERHDGNSSGSDEDLPNRKRLCETTSLAKHRGEWVNGSVGPQSHPKSKPTECEYGYRMHSGTSIILRSTR